MIFLLMQAGKTLLVLFIPSLGNAPVKLGNRGGKSASSFGSRFLPPFSASFLLFPDKESGELAARAE
ncbi:MAG: hypothetical protein GX902_06835 [Lentisphaerae bacterium]|nr:hypothetical protein [Lentisphaerota bacterium]